MACRQSINRWNCSAKIIAALTCFHSNASGATVHGAIGRRLTLVLLAGEHGIDSYVMHVNWLLFCSRLRAVDRLMYNYHRQRPSGVGG